MEQLNNINYIYRLPKNNSSTPPCIILIHGYGSNEEDLFSFADDLPDSFFVISVQAPHKMMMGGYAWYAIDFVNAQKFNNIPEGIASRDSLITFIDLAIAKHKLDAHNIWLCGFSQGAILSYSIALNYPKKIKNVLCLSGYPEPDFIGEIDSSKNYKHLNFFISHGVDDVVIPVEWAQRAKPLLDDLKIPNSYHEYRSGHGIVPQNYHDMLAWMNKNL